MSDSEKETGVEKETRCSTPEPLVKVGAIQTNLAPLTPDNKRTHEEMVGGENPVPVVDLAKSPKKRKHNVGPTPYSRTPWMQSISSPSFENAYQRQHFRYPIGKEAIG